MIKEIKEIKEILSDAKHTGGAVTLHGSGQFMNCRNEVVSPYDVLQSLQKKQDAIERVECLIRALPTGDIAK